MSLWITYAWKDNDEGNFDYLVQELKNFGVNTRYDKIELIAGQRLWSQIADKINDDGTTGWAYLITPNSLQSEACLEELYYALNRALESKDKVFPLIGLVVSEVLFQSVPTALKIRLCVSLANPLWKEQIKAGLELKPVQQFDTPQTRFIYKVTQHFNGVGIVTVVEIRPRFEEAYFWRIAVPNTAHIQGFGIGPSNTGSTVGNLEMSVQGGQINVNGRPFQIVGAANKLTAGTSAYIFIDNETPDTVLFGLASNALGTPSQWEQLRLK